MKSLRISFILGLVIGKISSEKSDLGQYQGRKDPEREKSFL
jgi:hypothetical protein